VHADGHVAPALEVGAVGRPDDPLACSGLAADRDTARYLWNHRIAAIAADNPAMEVLPVDRATGFQHHRVIALLGGAVGEFWLLDRLAATCREQRRYEFLLTSGVLPVPSGVGSPAGRRWGPADRETRAKPPSRFRTS
jgi:hypothetical protein